MEPDVYTCDNPGCPASGYIWDVRPADPADAKRCPHCQQRGHRLTDREREEAGV